MEKQIVDMREHLTDITGARGLANILNSTGLQNYVPTNLSRAHAAMLLLDAEATRETALDKRFHSSRIVALCPEEFSVAERELGAPF